MARFENRNLRFKPIKNYGKGINEVFIKDNDEDYYISTEDKVVEILNEQNNKIKRFEKECTGVALKSVDEPEVCAIVTVGKLLEELTSIKKYAFEKNDERIYLCADHIEKELHKLRYGGAKLDTDW